MSDTSDEELTERLASTIRLVDTCDLHDRQGHVVGVIGRGGSHIRYGCIQCGRQFVDVVASDPYTHSESSKDWKLPCAYRSVISQRAVRLVMSEEMRGMNAEEVQEYLRGKLLKV